MDSLLLIFENESLHDTIRVESIFKFCVANVSNQPDSTIIYADKAIKFIISKNSTQKLSSFLRVKGIAHVNKGNYDISLKYYFDALEIAEKAKNTKEMASIYNNISVNFWYQKNYEKQKEYLEKAHKIWLDMGSKKDLSKSYNNLGILYVDIEQYDKALEHYQKSLELKIEFNDQRGIATIYNNQGIIYLKQNKYREAGEVSKNALKIFEELKDFRGILVAKSNLATIAFETKKYSDAINFSEEIIPIAIEIDSKEDLKGLYDILNQSHYNLGNYKKAYDYQKLYTSVKDTLTNIMKIEVIEDIERKYQSEKKEQQIQIQDLKIREQNQQIENSKIVKYALIGGIFLLFMMFLLLYNRYSFKQKTSKIISVQKEALEIKNREITQSIQYAQKIQSALIPNEEIFKKTLPDSFIIFKPKDIVSGDFYWLSDREDYIFYATADSTGHGVPGGFMSMLGTALLNEIIDERKVKDCGEVLTLMREKIIQALKQTGDSESKDGMDMVLIRIDKKTLKMEYAAANNSFYIIRNNQLLEQDCDKMPVGVYHSEVKPFQTFTHQLQKGDVIYTYTDGYADQFGGGNNKKYTYKKFREKFLEIQNKPLSEQKNILEKEFDNWKSNNEQVDDVCVIGVKV